MIMLATILGMDPATAATVIGTVVTLLTLLSAIIYRSFAVQGLSGQLAAKDAVITTNQQTIEAFEGRISTLESKLSEVVQELARSHGIIESLQSQIINWESRYMSLRDFVVPASLTRLIEVLEEDRQNDPNLGDLIEDLKKTRNKLEAWQNRDK